MEYRKQEDEKKNSGAKGRRQIKELCQLRIGIRTKDLPQPNFINNFTYRFLLFREKMPMGNLLSFS